MSALPYAINIGNANSAFSAGPLEVTIHGNLDLQRTKIIEPIQMNPSKGTIAEVGLCKKCGHNNEDSKGICSKCLFVYAKSLRLKEKPLAASDFLQESPETWPNNDDYNTGCEKVKRMPVVNDACERALGLLTEFNTNKIIKDSQQKQCITFCRARSWRSPRGFSFSTGGSIRLSQPVVPVSDDDNSDDEFLQTTTSASPSAEDETKFFFDWECSHCHGTNEYTCDVCSKCRKPKSEAEFIVRSEQPANTLPDVLPVPPDPAPIADAAEPSDRVEAHVNQQIKPSHDQIKQKTQKKVKRMRSRRRRERKPSNGDGVDFRAILKAELGDFGKLRRASEIKSLTQFWPDENLLLNAKPSDVKQGSLGNCWLLCSISSLTKFTKGLHRVVLTPKVNDEGVYAFLLCKRGIWHVVIVDDYLPCDKERRLLFSNTEHLWVALLEKALAKLHGGYNALNRGVGSEGLTTLTGASCDSFQLVSPDNERAFQDTDDDPNWTKLLGYISAGRLISTCTPVFDENDEVATAKYDMVNLVTDHCYSVMDARCVKLSDKSCERLVQVRNPHGTRTWSGDWCRDSLKWRANPELVKLLQPRDPNKSSDLDLNDPKNKELDVYVDPYSSEDGTFWINWNDFCRYFTWIFASKNYDDYWYKVAVGGVFSGPSPHPVKAHFLRVKQATEVDLAVRRQTNRTFERHHKCMFDGYMCVFRSGGKDSDGRYILGELVAFALCQINCPMTCGRDLEPGDYLVVCLSFQEWPVKQGFTLSSEEDPSRYVLTMHSEQRLLLVSCHLVDNSFTDAVIKLASKAGYRERRQDVPATTYRLSCCGTGTIIVAENRHPDSDLQVYCDCSLSKNVTSTRGDMRTTDVIPPGCRLVVQVLSVVDSDSQLPSQETLYLLADFGNLGSWLHPGVLHEPALQQKMKSLHQPRPIEAE